MRKIEFAAAVLVGAALMTALASGVLGSSGGEPLLRIENIGPIKSVRGFSTGNSDNTYYPGDFFSITVRIRPDGHHGRAVEGKIKKYKQVAKPQPSYWYEYMWETVKENCKDGVFTNEEDAKERAGEIESNQDEWAGCDDARVARISAMGENFWKVLYSEHTWHVQKLKVDPVIKIPSIVFKSGKPWPVFREKKSVSVKEGKKETTREVKFQVRREAVPGKYYVQLIFPVPSVSGDHNNPYENVAEPIVVRENFRVVKYEPKLWQIPYLELGWKPEATNWMIQKPNSIVTRYDGSENESGVPDLNRRAVASAVSVSGEIIKPLRASDTFPQLHDDGSPRCNGDNLPFTLDLGDNVTLAKKPGGDYYESGAVFSPVIDVGKKTEWNVIKWLSHDEIYSARAEREKPDGTHVEVWLRVSSSDKTVGGILAGTEWKGPYTYETGLNLVGRYVQYMILLYTEDTTKTPTVGSVILAPEYGDEIENTGFNLTQYSWERKRSRAKLENDCPGVVNERCHEGYSFVRKVEMYHEGELLRIDAGVPKMGTVELLPKHIVSSDTGVRIRLELVTDEESLENRDLVGRTSTLEEAPGVSDLYLENARSVEMKEVGGEKISVFSPKNPQVNVYRNTAFKYDSSHRYRKWSFLFLPGASDVTVYPGIMDWFKDADVNVGVQFWFHQRVSGWNGEEKDSYKKLFSSVLKWSPMSTRQPVRVTSWELKDGLEDEVLEEPSMVFQDNVWKIDKDVKFDLTFTGMNDSENFLEMSHRAAKQLAPMVFAGNGKIQKIDPASENVIKSFKFPEPRLQGLAYGDGCLWGVGWGSENSGDETIYKLDPSDGDVVRKFSPPTSSPASIAWDGQHLWIAHEGTRTIHKIDPRDGSVVGTISSPGFRPTGLTWSDNGLWYADEHLENIYRLDPSNGRVVGELSLQNFNSSALAWDNRFLWVVSEGSLTGGNKIRKVNSRTGDVVGSFTLPGSSPTALAWGDRYLWTAIPGSETAFENTVKRLVESENFRERMAEMGLSIGKEGVEGLRGSLLALAKMDNRMMNMILDDWEIENAGAQSIFGMGRAVKNIDYRIGGYYAISENVKPPGENVVKRTETARLPFDPDEVANFDINVTGEGLVAEVKSDGPHQAVIKIYAPDRAGGIRSAVLYDNEGNVLVERDFGKSAFGWLPQYMSAMRSGDVGGVLEERKSETKTLSFTKWENCPTHLEIEMTNEWGATVEQELRVSPGRAVSFWETNVTLKWLVLAGVLVVLWTSFVKWWKGSRKS